MDCCALERFASTFACDDMGNFPLPFEIEKRPQARWLAGAFPITECSSAKGGNELSILDDVDSIGNRVGKNPLMQFAGGKEDCVIAGIEAGVGKMLQIFTLSASFNETRATASLSLSSRVIQPCSP